MIPPLHMSGLLPHDLCHGWRSSRWLLADRLSSVQSLSRVQLLVTPRTAANQASLSITNSCSLLKLLSIESVMPSNHFNLCRPLLLLPSIFPSIRVFSNESVLHISWPQDWSFSFSTRTYNVYSGLISFRMDWLDLLAVQGTLKSLLQYQSSKASIRAPVPDLGSCGGRGLTSECGRKLQRTALTKLSVGPAKRRK